MASLRILPLVLLLGCWQDEEEKPCYGIPDHLVPPIEGERWTTGKLGLVVYTPQGRDGAEICLEIERVTEEWITYWERREGWQRIVLLSRARQVPIVIYDRKGFGCCKGFYKYESHAGIAFLGGFNDRYFGRYLFSVDIWFHEATHGLKREFHDAYGRPIS
jgi:hypothetical protein